MTTTDKPSAGELASRETLLKLLREEAAREDHRGAGLILRQAAAEIERLRSPPVAGAEVGVLREALEPFAANADRYEIGAPETPDQFQVYVSLGDCRKARALLSTPVAERGAIPERETWWLIEREGTGLYTTSTGSYPGWTNDPWRAYRYETAREADNARLLMVSLRDESAVTEHIFINKPPRVNVSPEPVAERGGGGAWQPIETAPKDGSYVLISSYKYVDVARWSHGSFGGFDRDDELRWQPLPTPYSVPSPETGDAS